MDKGKKFNKYINKQVDEKIENIINFFYKNVFPVNRFYIYPNIPWKKFGIARERFVFLQKEEHLLGFYDDTLFGSGKDGLAITTRGIYWKAIFADPEFRKFEQLCDMSIEYNNINRFFLIDNQKIYMNMLNKNDINNVVMFLKKTSHFFKGLELSFEEKNTFNKKTEQLFTDNNEYDIKKTDLNNAPKDILFILEFFDLDNTDNFINVRKNRNGFDSIEEAGEVLGLSPHEIILMGKNCFIGKYKSNCNSNDNDDEIKKTFKFGRRVVDY
ncbi:MAG: hypothetical protein M0R46_15920 [Candidatus Muirbacterium halophilum]|nr:hypothetical protein [Candidatus Muirbacterium halophilum]MCK9477403.1 hypothetical protein [Candidatus Muirbacterium halophilum]